MEDFIIKLLRTFCPYLKAMAAKTGSPVDDIIVGILCRVAEDKKEEA